LLIVALSRVVTTFQTASAQNEKVTSSFVPDARNETTLSIRGWEQMVLNRILADFGRLYGLLNSSPYRVEPRSNDTFVVTFPGDIEPRLLLFLVNYVRYPKGFDLANRSIGVLARAVLTPAFGAPASALVGTRANFYVPANDTEYDLVYAQDESGRAYRIPFTSLRWEPAADARVPETVSGL
jgi:hypothetical protein